MTNLIVQNPLNTFENTEYKQPNRLPTELHDVWQKGWSLELGSIEGFL